MSADVDIDTLRDASDHVIDPDTALAALGRLAAAIEAARYVARQLRATRHADGFYVSDRALDALDAALAAVAPPLDHSDPTGVDSRA